VDLLQTYWPSPLPAGPRLTPLPVNTIGPKVKSHLGIDQLAVDRLYGKGLLSRVESAADRRISIVALTPRGKKFLFFESTRIVAQVGVWIFGGKDFIIQGSGN
jgi:hypothetical protein